MKVITIKVKVIEDHHPVKWSAALLRQIADDVVGAVSEHERIEGNAVEAVSESIE